MARSFAWTARSQFVILSGRELVDEACEETRFDKLISTSLSKVRTFSGDGLFTAWTFEPNWAKAHAILLPNFGAGRCTAICRR